MHNQNSLVVRKLLYHTEPLLQRGGIAVSFGMREQKTCGAGRFHAITVASTAKSLNMCMYGNSCCCLPNHFQTGYPLSRA
jgi:hypothetical protein